MSTRSPLSRHPPLGPAPASGTIPLVIEEPTVPIRPYSARAVRPGTPTESVLSAATAPIARFGDRGVRQNGAGGPILAELFDDSLPPIPDNYSYEAAAAGEPLSTAPGLPTLPPLPLGYAYENQGDDDEGDEFPVPGAAASPPRAPPRREEAFSCPHRPDRILLGSGPAPSSKAGPPPNSSSDDSL
ncbi:hypothetical protein PAPYR_12669 [Paratrimastix pyriformis]|uniref:Uncharacterized protein n=1 Tax=Paratrimastix pyriformis TaxID=342808 RepID=A0ABQ8U852_9EUKA|nr:hypothetical protein PAPYR_12669 [Paratrimastix pyriformis]